MPLRLKKKIRFFPLTELVTGRLKLTRGVDLLFCLFAPPNTPLPPTLHRLKVICILSSPHFGPAAG